MHSTHFSLHPQFTHNLTTRDAYKCALPVRVTPFIDIVFEIRLYPETPETEVVYLLTEDIFMTKKGRDDWISKIWRYPNYNYHDAIAVLTKGMLQHDFELNLGDTDGSLVDMVCSDVPR